MYRKHYLGHYSIFLTNKDMNNLYAPAQASAGRTWWGGLCTSTTGPGTVTPPHGHWPLPGPRTRSPGCAGPPPGPAGSNPGAGSRYRSLHTWCDIIHTRTHRRLTYLFIYIEKLSLGRTGGRLSLVSSPRLPSEREARAYIPPGGRRPFAHDLHTAHPGSRPMQVQSAGAVGSVRCLHLLSHRCLHLLSHWTDGSVSRVIILHALTPAS